MAARSTKSSADREMGNDNPVNRFSTWPALTLTTAKPPPSNQPILADPGTIRKAALVICARFNGNGELLLLWNYFRCNKMQR
jgi:hypothetical protein